MKVSSPAIIVPTVAAILSAVAVHLPGWVDIRPALIPAIGVLAAAVLVRLARGLPFTNPDHFTLEEFRAVSTKLQVNARYLRALIVVCIAAILAITVGPALFTQLPPAPSSALWLARVTEGAISAAIGYLMAYSFVRILEVVQSDVMLLKLQSQVLENVITNKNAKAFDAKLSAQPPGKIAGSETFGRPLQ